MSDKTSQGKGSKTKLGTTRGPTVTIQKTTVAKGETSAQEVIDSERRTTEPQHSIGRNDSLNSSSKDCNHGRIQTALPDIKERWNLLKSLTDQPLSKVHLDNLTTLSTNERKPDVLGINIFLQKYGQGLAIIYMEHICFHKINQDSVEALKYATELDSLVHILQNKELKEEKYLVENASTKTCADLDELKKKHCDFLSKANRFLDTVSSPDHTRHEYNTIYSFYPYHVKAFNLQKCIDINLECLKIANSLKDEKMENTSLAQQALLYQLMGKYQDCYDIYKPILKKGPTDDYNTYIVSLINTSVVLLLLGKKEESLSHAEESLKYCENVKNYRRMAVCHGNIGLAYESMAKYELALEHYQDCLSLGKQEKEDRIINNSYCNIGRAYEGLQQDQMAMQYYEEAVNAPQPAYSHWCDTIDMRFSGDYLLGKLLIKYKEWEKAKKYLQATVERCELQRKSIEESSLKIVFNDTQRKPYQYLQYVLLQLGETEEALLVAEKARARDFYDKVVHNKQNKVPLNSIQDLQEFVKKHDVAVLMLSTLDVVNKLCGWLILPNGRVKNFSVQNIDWKELLHELCVSLLFLHDHNLTETRGVEGEENDHKPAEGFSNAPKPSLKDSSSRSSILRTGDSGACAEEIEKAFSQFTECIEKLRSLVLQPIENDLDELVKDCTEKPKLVFIPQLLTFNIPFAALELHGEPLCKSITPFEAFSFHSLSHANSQVEKPDLGKSQDILIVGNPTLDLDNAQEEATRIGKLLGVTPLIGCQATRSNVMSCLPHAPIIHFACHGDINGKSLRLADFESSKMFLTVTDITKVDANLVVLSACHTHRGEVSNEGILGLCRAFIIAGAKSVVTTLWAIPDEATLYFMEKFYKKLISGDHVADALAMTMDEMRNTDGYEHYFFWGAFKHVGANCKIF